MNSEENVEEQGGGEEPTHGIEMTTGQDEVAREEDKKDKYTIPDAEWKIIVGIGGTLLTVLLIYGTLALITALLLG